MKWALFLAVVQEFRNAAPTVLEHRFIAINAVTLT